ncbi:hypothetical protein [Mucilaginibacter sp. KACC 22063]|uniref:hypothetical protein n=1 Tax=Mucilaginibacter sp. KACC 22063 TaxID=3025666 RepID=UPI0023663194|nr:hypothetical protein [Mucilaginibacter sp. KACC 22063]WDF57244.1 hypothetical protein PQ461_09285 [Mucilaginibacter sp. KACC 22063]
MINNKKSANYKASEFIYDLGNTALENGFKPDEVWDVQIATASEKKALDKQYCPLVATSVSPELLNETFALVKAQLNQVVKIQNTIQDRFAPEPVYEYLIAFNPARVRR